MFRQIDMNSDRINWLLEPDTPSVCYLTMRDLLDYKPEDLNLIEAHQTAHQEGAIAMVLDAMNDKGYWVKPGAGYSGKYKSTVWAVILLAQLGASASLDSRIGRACDHLLQHALTENGQFGTQGNPSTNIDCLQGNLCAAMIDLGIADERLMLAFEWMARSITGEGIAPRTNKEATLRYYSNNSGSGFLCGYNNHKACAWGAIKCMLAFSKLPDERRTPLMQDAIELGVEFLLNRDPALADYPTGNEGRPSRKWWKFSFPVFYVTDLLQNVEALTSLGYGHDPRLHNAINMIHDKQDEHGRWTLENTYKTWANFGQLKQPNKWVTLRALRVLKAVA